MRRTKTGVLLLATLVGLAAFVIPTAVANAGGDHDKVTICHAAGQAGTTKYVELTISEHAVYKEQGGHFEEDGTPQAGHELDYFGPCKPDETTTTPPSTVPEVTTTEPPCTGDPATDPSGCPIDDCALPEGNRPAECDPPTPIPPAPPADPVPDEPTLAG